MIKFIIPILFMFGGPLGYSQVNGEIIEEEVIEEPINRSPEAIKKTEMAYLKREISMTITDAWSSNNYALLEPYLSKEIKIEAADLQRKMGEINKSYGTVNFSTQAKNKIFHTTYWNKAERHRLAIRHFFRENGDGFQVFMIIITIQKEGEEMRVDYPAINGEIVGLIQDLDYDRFSSHEEQLAMSQEGLMKSKQAIQDSTIARFGLKTLISNLFEASVKMGKPTSEIIDFKFIEDDRSYKETVQQYILISYAEKGEFDLIEKYANELGEAKKKHFRTTDIKDFYRDPNDYNIYREPYGKIMELLGKE